MKVHKPDDIPAEPVNAPLFTGGPVTRQTLLTPEASNYFNLGIVNFSPGARNKMHTHSSDQVLFVTAGKGIIATETEQQIIVPVSQRAAARAVLGEIEINGHLPVSLPGLYPVGHGMRVAITR